MHKIILALTVVTVSVAATATAQDNTSCCDAGCCTSYSGCDGGCCESAWSVRANLLYMTREDPSSRVLLSNAGNNASIFDANQFDFDFEAGWDVAVLHRVNECQSFEFRYLSLGDLSAAGDFSFTPVGTVFFETMTPTTYNVGTPPLNGSLTYETEIDGFEMNIRRESCGHTFVVGLRYVSLDERLAMDFDQPNVANFQSNYHWITGNDLFGAQLGIEQTIGDNDCSPFGFAWFAKGGLYYNHQETSFRALGAGFNHSGATDDDKLATLVEVGLTCEYELTCNLSLRAGYQLMWFNGVALATDQVAGTVSLDGGPGPRNMVLDDDGLLLHGGFFGMEYRR